MILKKATKSINNLFYALGLVFLSLTIIALTIQVFTRYVLKASMTGTEELARFCFVWVCMLGSSIGVGKGIHATITFLNDNLKGKLKIWHKQLIECLILFVAIIIIKEGMSIVMLTTEQLSPSLGIPMSYVYLAVPVGGAGILLNGINNILERLKIHEKEKTS